LRLLYEVGSTRGVQVKHVQRLCLQLAALDRAKGPNDLAVPAWRLHPLKGVHAGFWSIWVDASWRLTFRFVGRESGGNPGGNPGHPRSRKRLTRRGAGG
jgi:proteic killer suppression protein